MTSEIRTNSLTSRAGLSTVTLTDSGPMFSGITTFVDNSTFSVGTGGTIHAPATNTLNIGVNNTESLRIDSNSNLKVAGIVTATHFYGNGSNLTGITGTSLSGSTNNTVCTVTGANAIQGEAGLTYDGSKLSIKGADTATGSGGPSAVDIKQGDANNEFVNLSLQTGSGGPLAVISAIADATGVYPNTTGQLRFSTQVGGGLFERMFIKSNGDIGLGESSPNRSGYSSPVTSVGYNSTNGYSVLELLGNKTSDDAIANIVAYNVGGSSRVAAIAFERSGANNSGAIRFETYASGSSAERLRITSGGQIRLPVNGQQMVFGASQQFKMYWENSEDRMYLQGDGAYGIVFRVNSGNRIEIDKTTGDVTMQGSSGRNFQWDNSDPSLYLTDNGSGASAKLKIGTGGDLQLYHDVGGANHIVCANNQELKLSANLFSFYEYTGVTQRFRIDSSGNVIIRGSNCNNSSVNGQALQINGTTRPTLILRGNASGGNTCEIQFADNSGTDSDPGTRVGLIKYEHAGTYANHMHFHTSDTERVVISHNGRFGIANSPAELAGFAENLQVTGLYNNQYAAAFKIKQSSGNLMRFATTVSGSYNLCGGITVNGSSTSFNTSSDYRLKENDVKISDGITRLKQLRPIRFNWKTDSSTTEDGFFAHEVSPVVPESVSGEKDAPIDEIGEGYQKIDHSKLVPLLTAALQEAITKIEKLEQDNIALRARVTNLEGN